MVGFTCYLWNVERSLWIAGRLKQRRPELKVLLGGPEITADNRWVLENTAVDYAVLGEGEATFAELLAEASHSTTRATTQPTMQPMAAIPGLWQSALRTLPPPRAPLENLDAISSPYGEGILDPADSGRLLLETVRGCRFRCKYCYYHKNHGVSRFLSNEQIAASLKVAAERRAAEVVLLDPTLNERPDFADFLRLLRRGNVDRRLAFFGELRAEGIDPGTARLLREANFREVEIGLQSVEPRAWALMGRPTNLAGFERGVRLLLDEGIKVRVDLILGLPGDTVDSVRRGIDFLQRTQAYSEVQVFNLSILPGTAFRREAEALGLSYQPWPPYYALKTPTLDMEQMFALMEESQEAFETEFDPIPPPRLEFGDEWGGPRRVQRIDLDAPDATNAEADFPALVFSLWFRSADFHRQRRQAAERIAGVLADNPHTTLQVVLEPIGDPERLTIETLESLLSACYRTTTYLDRYYSMQPGRLLGSKRLVVLLPAQWRDRLSESWLAQASETATLQWRDERLC